MNVWPVMAREVRQASRQPWTYRVRWIAALAVLGMWVTVSLQPGGLAPGKGGEVFARLQIAVFLSLWVLVPLMTADCLSSERREGTLGLLFLTPLRALDIVFAKVFLHGLRGVTLWLAAIPVFAIPILIGGVSWQQSVAAVMHNLSTLMIGLAAGVLASAFSKTWSKAMVWALLCACLFMVVWAHLLGVGAHWYLDNLRGGSPSGVFDRFFNEWACAIGGALVVLWPDSVENVSWMLSISTAQAANHMVVLSVIFFSVSLVMLAVACVIASRGTRRCWQEEPPSALRVAIRRRFTTPILGQDLLKRWLRRTLERNPVGWLEQRTWTGRLVMFGWLAIVIGVFSGVAGQIDFWMRNMRRHDVDLINVLLAQPLLLSMAATAAGSFRRERESGVVELLLVSPLSAFAMVMGRIRGLYVQFMPSVILIVCGWVFLLMAFPSVDSSRFLAALRFAVWSVAIPCIGLYWSLATRNFLAAFLLTVVTGWAGPWLTGFIYRFVTVRTNPAAVFTGEVGVLSALPILMCLFLGCSAIWLLIWRLERRAFEFNQEVT